MVTPKTWLPASCLSSVQLKIAASRCCWAASSHSAPVSDAEGVGLLCCPGRGGAAWAACRGLVTFLVHGQLSPLTSAPTRSPWVRPHRASAGPARGAWPLRAAWFSGSPGQWFLLTGGLASLGTWPASRGLSSAHTHLGFHVGEARAGCPTAQACSVPGLLPCGGVCLLTRLLP